MPRHCKVITLPITERSHSRTPGMSCISTTAKKAYGGRTDGEFGDSQTHPIHLPASAIGSGLETMLRPQHFRWPETGAIAAFQRDCGNLHDLQAQEDSPTAPTPDGRVF